jgi:hypothetical protein
MDTNRLAQFLMNGEGNVVNFWDCLRESVIVQGIVTSALTITVCILAIKGMDIPTWFVGAYGSVLGFWFGAKVQHATENARRNRG